MKKTDRTKYKTELCKNWIEVGVCRYEGKCQFAHGEDELVGKLPPTNSKYKSKTCTTFNEKLYCPYGKRCLFRHDDRAVEEIFKYNYSMKLTFLPESYQNSLYSSDLMSQKDESKRLKIFQEMTSTTHQADNC